MVLWYSIGNFGGAWFRQGGTGAYKQVVMVTTIKDRKKLTDEVKLFVVLEEGLLFLDDGAEVVREDCFSAEKTLVPVSA